jgi:hypothetical protein
MFDDFIPIGAVEVGGHRRRGIDDADRVIRLVVLDRHIVGV